MSPTDEFYIIDLRPEWARKPYLTVWRPDNAGYAFPLSWGGIYSRETIDREPHYYATRMGYRQWKRFPVPRAVVERLAQPKPRPGIIDGDAGPVLPNDANTKAALRKARYLPDTLTDEVQK